MQAAFNSTLQIIEANIPQGRYCEIAITQLELARAAATKGIFKNNDGSPRIAESS